MGPPSAQACCPRRSQGVVPSRPAGCFSPPTSHPSLRPEGVGDTETHSLSSSRSAALGEPLYVHSALWSHTGLPSGHALPGRRAHSGLVSGLRRLRGVVSRRSLGLGSCSSPRRRHPTKIRSGRSGVALRGFQRLLAVTGRSDLVFQARGGRPAVSVTVLASRGSGGPVPAWMSPDSGVVTLLFPGMGVSHLDQ